MCGLEKLLKICERELSFLDMFVNFKKCTCICIGPRCTSMCRNISSTNVTIPWVNEFKYLGVNLVNSHTFKRLLDHAKKSFYRRVNAIFGKIGRTASEEVILELIRSKCIPLFSNFVYFVCILFVCLFISVYFHCLYASNSLISQQ